MDPTEERKSKIEKAEKIIGYTFSNKQLIESAITHPSAAGDNPIQYSYERLEFLGDSVLGAIVAQAAFHKFPDVAEGDLTKIKVSLVSGESLSRLSRDMGIGDVIIFGSSEKGTGGRGLRSALENVYEALVGAVYLDGGLDVVKDFIGRTLIPRMGEDMSDAAINPKSELQERLQEYGITPSYKIIETQGPPHDRRFVSKVYAGDKGLACGFGRTKKEAESHAAKAVLDRWDELFEVAREKTDQAQLKYR